MNYLSYVFVFYCVTQKRSNYCPENSCLPRKQQEASCAWGHLVPENICLPPAQKTPAYPLRRKHLLTPCTENTCLPENSWLPENSCADWSIASCCLAAWLVHCNNTEITVCVAAITVCAPWSSSIVPNGQFKRHKNSLQ
jgi:hypothetical protein